MTRIVLLFSLCLISFVGLAQKKLKMEVSSSGDTTYSTKESKIYTSPSSKHSISEYLKSTVYKTRNGFMLGFSIQTGRTNRFTIGAGSVAEIWLVNGQKLYLETLGSRESKGSVVGYGSFTFTFYSLSPNEVNQLKESPVKFVRVNTSAGNFDYDIKEKFSSVIADQLARF